MKTQQEFAHKIIDLAFEIAAAGGPNVAISYRSASNTLSVTAGNPFEPPMLDESIQLTTADDSIFMRQRAAALANGTTQRLREILRACTITPRPAA